MIANEILIQLQTIKDSIANYLSSIEYTSEEENILRFSNLIHSLTTDFTGLVSLNPGDKALINDDTDRYNIILEKTGHIAYDCLSSKIKWQGAIEKITGFSPKELNEFTIDRYLKQIHEDDRQRVILKHDLAKKALQNFHLEYRFHRKDGHYVYIEDNGQYIADHLHGTRLFGVLTDITGRKEAEVLLQAKERSSRLLRDISLNTTEPQTVEEVLYQAMKVISSYTRWIVGRAIYIYKKENLPKQYQPICYSLKPERYTRLIDLLNNEKLTLNPIHLNVLVNKKGIWVKNLEKNKEHDLSSEAVKWGLRSAIIFPVFIAGQVIALLEFFSEFSNESDLHMPELMEQIGIQLGIIVERKAAEEELKKLIKAIEQINASVLITNSDGYIEYVNPKFTEISGYEGFEVLGKKPSILKSGIHSTEYYSDLWNTILEGKIWRSEICNKSKNGKLYWEKISISPVKNPKGEITHFVAVKDDITEKKIQEEELNKAKDLAESANKAKSEFLANMSHEIRTPMNAILGFTELLTNKITDEQQRNFLDSIRNSGRNLLTLINDVLDLSKVEAGKMNLNLEFIDPFLVFKDIEYLFSIKAHQKGLDFSIETDLSLPISIEIDEVRLRQILVNLIGNALKFTEQGFVKVKVSCSKNEPEETINMIIQVNDSGIGINKAFLNNLFTPFTQQDGQSTKKYGGTGLGLTITKKLVELLNGSIKVDSEEGKGSHFEITLSNLRARGYKQHSTEISTINPRDIRFKPATIVIADDVDANRNYLKGILDDTEINIFDTDSGMDAFEMVKLYKPSVVITDLKMSGLNGFQLLEKIRETKELSRIPVIATTASVSIDEKHRNQVHNFDGILIKPIQVNDVFLELLRFLPHEIISDNEAKKEMQDNIAITAIPDSEIRTVKLLLENDYFTLWKTFESQQPINEVEEFAKQIKELGKKYSLDILISYGNRLLLSINNFDIDSMLKTLKDYPKLISTFKVVND